MLPDATPLDGRCGVEARVQLAMALLLGAAVSTAVALHTVPQACNQPSSTHLPASW